MQTARKQSIENFLNYLAEQERSPATLEKYRRDIAAFHHFIGEAELSKEAVLSYKRYLSERYATSSVNSMLAAVNSYLKWLDRYDCLVRFIKVQHQSFRNQDRILELDEYSRLLDAAKSSGRYRLFYLLQTICATGIRVSELKYITVEAVHMGRAVVALKGKTRQILLPVTLCRQLEEYASLCRIASGSIFITRSGHPLDRSNILHDMKSLCTLAGVDSRKVFPHNLRHLFACEYYKRQHDLGRLADILGHSSVDTTRIYTSVSGDEQRRQIDSLGLVRQW